MTRRLLSFFIFCFCVCCLPFESKATSEEATAARSSAREYVIGVGDGLNILIWGFPEFSSTVAVRSDGKITLPMIGDVQAARLTTLMLKTRLASGEFIGKYVTNPNITITVAKSTEDIIFTVNGQSFTELRGTTIRQLLEKIVPTLPAEPAPNLSAIKIVGVDQEFIVDWTTLQAGRSPEMNVLLQWGDEILIPSVEEAAVPQIAPISAETPQIKTFTREELLELLGDVPQEKVDAVFALAAPQEDGRYTLDVSKMSEEQKQQIGEEALNRLFPPSQAPSEYQEFSNITLVALAVNLARQDGVEAYLAIPDPESAAPPTIRSAGEGDLVQKGETPEDDIYLEEINDIENVAILRKEDALQRLPLAAQTSEMKLSGIQKYGKTRKAFFSKLPKVSEKKSTPRVFGENDELPDGAKIAQITDNWVLLQRNAAFELLLLRDSYRRAPATEPAQSVMVTDAGEKEALTSKNPMELPTSAVPPQLLNALPKPLKALNTFSKVFFATPVFE